MTEQVTPPPYDKSRWGRGEWDTEPDRKDFIHAGFSCFVLRNHMGNWCGYVGVPEGHPAYQQSYEEVDVDVHGGLTYAAPCEGHICHVPEPGMPDDVWWLGFDCGHAFDLSPSLGILRSRGLRTTYRNLAYVVGEVESLAEQLQALAKP